MLDYGKITYEAHVDLYCVMHTDCRVLESLDTEQLHGKMHPARMRAHASSLAKSTQQYQQQAVRPE